MSLDAQWSTFLVALIGALVPVIPLGVGLLRTYIKVVENRIAIDKLPTESKVGELFHQKLKEAGLDGGTNGDTTGHADPGAGAASTD